jgi:hypothetical protein
MQNRQLISIKNFINNSPLNNPDKENLLKLVSSLSEQEVDYLWWALRDNPGDITLLNRLVKMKKDALVNQDTGAWAAVLKEEKEELNKIITT